MDGPDIGHVVYFIVAGPFVKVGYSNKVRARMRELQTGNPYELCLVHTVGYPTRKEAMCEERVWRERLLKCGKAAYGEWVKLEPVVVDHSARREPFRLTHISEIVATCGSRDILEDALRSRAGLLAPLSKMAP